VPANYYMAPVGPFGIADATAVTAAALTDGTPQPAPVLPANAIDFPGKRLEIQAWGHYTTTATQGTVTIGLYSGTIGQAIGSATLLAVSGAITWVASQTSRPWRLEANIQFRQVGTSGTGICIAEISNISSAATDMAMTNAGSTFAIDTTVARYLAIGITPSLTAQTITTRYFGVRAVN
jgi:hypothetical protein